MRELIELPVELRRDEVIRFLGYPEGHEPAARSGGLIDDVLAEARTLVQARGTFRRLPLAEATAVGLDPLAAEGLVIGLATIGGAVEERVATQLRAGRSSQALVYDAAGSAAVEEAADRLGAVIVAELGGLDRAAARAAAAGASFAASVSCRVSPGYGRWKLAAQRALFDRLPYAELGVELLPSFLMMPRKSVSFAMWLGADARPLAGLSGCARCPLTQCRYRRGGDG